MHSATMTSGPTLLKKRQRHSRWFAFLLIPLIVFSIGMLKNDGWVEETMEWTGFFFIVFCVLGRSYCSAFIGGIKNERVVREGPFSVVRNPLYVFSFLGIVGIGLQSSRVSILLILVLSYIFYYRQVVKREEAFLLHKFDEPYQRYMNEVPRWWPKFSLWNEPAEITVRPCFIRHTMMDALVFFIPWPVFEILQLLQSNGVIPSLLILP